jgi:hypothetical protein
VSQPEDIVEVDLFVYFEHLFLDVEDGGGVVPELFADAGEQALEWAHAREDLDLEVYRGEEGHLGLGVVFLPVVVGLVV